MKIFGSLLIFLVFALGLQVFGGQSSLSIQALSTRAYDGGQVVVERVLERNRSFTRSLVHWQSDSTTQYGFMDIPKGRGPFATVIMIHGHVNPATYQTLAYTTRYADALARVGYVVIHPNLRGHGLSGGKADPLFRVGYAVDVLNLIASLRNWGGKSGSLEQVNPKLIGVFGHSMGEGIALRVITVDAGIRAAVLSGAMSGDEKQNFQRISTVLSGGTRGLEELKAPASLLEQISPINYLERIQTPLSVHHGMRDDQVPLLWSLELCKKLKTLHKSVSCFTYPNAGHNFHGTSDAVFLARVKAFFALYLR